MFNINFADVWIRTADLFYRKQQSYQLSHIHFAQFFCKSSLELRAWEKWNQKSLFSILSHLRQRQEQPHNLCPNRPRFVLQSFADCNFAKVPSANLTFEGPAISQIGGRQN